MKQGYLRTDLALEATRALTEQAGGEVAGVLEERGEREGFPVTRIRVCTKEGAKRLGKPVGEYRTLELQALLRREADAFPRAVHALSAELRELMPPGEGSVLVVGLGNRLVTPDAIGPRATDCTLVTRHLIAAQPETFAPFRPVCALSAGVLGSTGVESGELVRGLVEQVHPAFVLAVDALAARSVHRLCTTIQIADTGIIPGSGVGNARKALNRETLGVPVIAIGVPTVVEAAALAADLTGNAPEGELGRMLVTPKDIDTLVSDLSKVIGYGIDLALQEGLTIEDIDLYLS